MRLAENEKIFNNVKAENVIKYIYDLIKPWDNRNIIEKQKFIYHHYKINRPKDTRIEFMMIESTKADGPPSQFPEQYPRTSRVFAAVVFEVWQLQQDTVSVKMSYFDVGLPVDDTWKKIIAAFSKRDEDHTTIKKITTLQKKPSRKKRRTCLPSTIGHARKWVITWDLIKDRIGDDPSLLINYDELKYFLKSKEITFQRETLKRIVACGRSKGIPPIMDFDK